MVGDTAFGTAVGSGAVVAVDGATLGGAAVGVAVGAGAQLPTMRMTPMNRINLRILTDIFSSFMDVNTYGPKYQMGGSFNRPPFLSTLPAWVWYRVPKDRDILADSCTSLQDWNGNVEDSQHGLTWLSTD